MNFQSRQCQFLPRVRGLFSFFTVKKKNCSLELKIWGKIWGGKKIAKVKCHKMSFGDDGENVDTN